MNHKTLSIRAFIGTKQYKESLNFYQKLGFRTISLMEKMSYVQIDENLGFYLQDAYVKQWVDNSMLFLEVEDIEAYHNKIKALNLPQLFKNVRVSEIQNEDWGCEFFVHDPSGILWHIGAFKNK